MDISIIGSRGRIGSALKQKLAKNGHKILCETNRGENPDLNLMRRSEATILAVPLDSAVAYIEELSGECTLVELSSIKEPMKKFAGEVVSIHPLFGPASFDNLDFKTVVFANDISPEGSLELVERMFPGNSVVSMTGEEHDRSMADLLVAPYLISMLAKKVLSSSQTIATPSFSNLRRFASLLDGENASVVWDTISLNKFSRNIVEKLEQELNRIRGELN